MDDAAAGRGRLFLLVGEPGIGKTRLAEELAERAVVRGASALWGRCWEHGGAPPFWPWIQVLRAAHACLADPAGGGAVDAQLAPFFRETEERGDDGSALRPQPAPADAQQRFSLFDAIASYLRDLACHRPLVLILDDLHAADTPSLLLLEFLAHELRQAPLCIVGTYREVELQRHAERLAVISRTARSGTRIPLAGLAEEDVARLIAQRASAPSAAFLAAVLSSTDGNPFFIDEIVRFWSADPDRSPSTFAVDSSLVIPLGVREAIGERLRALSVECRETLATAAVLGREFDFAPLERTSEFTAGSLLDQLGEATAGGMITVVDRGRRRYGFVHALLRETLYDELAPTVRRRLHHRVGEALETIHAADVEPHLAEIAYHFREAAGADVARATAYAERAGDHAACQHGYEDAEAHYRNALQILQGGGAGDARARQCELLLKLGVVQRAASSDAARASFLAAAALARQGIVEGRPAAAEQLARSALGFADRGIGAPQRLVDHEVMGLVEEALAGLGREDSLLRARLLARLAMERSLDEDGAIGVDLSQAAVDMAHRLGDHTTLAATLSCRQFVLWRVDNIRDRMSTSTEIIRLAEHSGDKVLALQGRSWRLVDLMGTGEVRGFDAEIDVLDAAAAALRQPRYQWLVLNLRAMRALWAGHWSEAESLAMRSLPLGERTGDPTVAISPWIQVFLAHRETGRLADQEAAARMGVARFPESPVPQTLLAIILLDLGRIDEARVEFESLAADGFENLRRQRRVGVLPHLAELCTALGDVARAGLLYRQLLPYARGIVPYGAVANFAAGAHYLALLAATQGEAALARAHFDYALDLHRRTGAPAWLAHTSFEYARFLGCRGGEADRRRAVVLATQALGQAKQLQMTALEQRAAALCTGIDDSAAAPRSSRPDVLLPLNFVFRLDGDFWSVGDSSGLTRIKDILGMRYLARLLRHPDRDLLCSDLVALENAPGGESDAMQSAARRGGESLPVIARPDASVASSDTLLDLPARVAYRRRLDDLRHDLDEATAFNDGERAARARAEIDFLLHELGKAVGLGGRSRPASAAAERSRLNVTRAIRAAIKRIRHGYPSLGRYLETTIRTGAYCSYQPDPRLPVEWTW